MFADSLCDSSWSNRIHRGWTTLASFGVQALAVGLMMTLPLIYPQGLPHLALISPLLVPSPPPAGPPASARVARSDPANTAGIRLLSPSEIPTEVRMLSESDPTIPAVDASVLGVGRGLGDPQTRGSVLGSFSEIGQIAPPLPPDPARQPRRVSRMMEGNLVYRVQPEYSPLARQARIQGEVVLHAIISRDGAIENLQVVSGHPMLVQSAIAAVRQWRYHPYVLNGVPTEVETQITVNFILAGR